MGEEATDSFVGVHVTLPKHSIDLVLREIMDNLLQALHHLPRPRWNPRNPTAALAIVASSFATHPLLHLSLFLLYVPPTKPRSSDAPEGSLTSLPARVPPREEKE